MRSRELLQSPDVPGNKRRTAFVEEWQNGQFHIVETQRLTHAHPPNNKVSVHDDAMSVSSEARGESAPAGSCSSFCASSFYLNLLDILSYTYFVKFYSPRNDVHWSNVKSLTAKARTGHDASCRPSVLKACVCACLWVGLYAILTISTLSLNQPPILQHEFPSARNLSGDVLPIPASQLGMVLADAYYTTP